MIEDFVFLIEGMTAFLRCSRRGSFGGATHDLVSIVDSSANTAKAPKHQDLSSVSTDDSNAGDVSDTESTELEASSNSKRDVMEVQHSMMPPGLEGFSLGNKRGEIVKESCLNKWAPPFVPGAPVACLDYVASGTDTNCSPDTKVHVRLPHSISTSSLADAATASAFLELTVAKETQVVQLAEYGNHRNGFCMLSNLAAPFGSRPPPGLEPPTQFEELRQPLPPGLVLPQAQIGATKIQDVFEVEENKLPPNLDELALFDPACIFLVEKINRLGLNSADFLKAYFAEIGMVECVLACHFIEKSRPGRRKPRLRPARRAFVVMSKPEDVAKILRFGSEYVVQDVSIVVSPYEQHERWSPG